MKSRGKKALLNTAVSGIYQLVHLLCGLILPRFLLLHFGSEYNGVTSSITQLLSFITVLQIGIAGSTRFSLYKVLADNDTKGISGIVNATEKYMRKVGFVLLVYIGVLAFIYPYIATTSLPAKEAALLVLIVGASSFAQYFFGITYQILLTADQKQYVYFVVSTVASVLNTIVAIVLMEIGCNIFIVKSCSAVIFVLVPLVLAIIVRRKYKIDKKVETNKEGLKGRWDVMWHSVANIVHNNTDLVVLTLFADVKLVSVYTVYYLVINGLYKVLSVFTGSLEAGFGNMFAKNEIKTAYKNLEFYEFFMSSFVSVFFSCALVLIVPFVKLYTSGVTDVNYHQPLFASVAVIAQMVMCIRQPYLTVVQAAGHYKQTRNGAFLEAGLNIVISVLLTCFFGIIGVAIGTLAANLVRTVQYMHYLSKNVIDRPLMKPIGMLLWTTINVLLVYVSGNLVLRFVEINQWFDWIVVGAICFAVAGAITLVSATLFYRNRLIKAFGIAKGLFLKSK